MAPRPDIKAKGKPEWTTLYDHLFQVSEAAICFARYLGKDVKLARLGGLLHDIGKAHPKFQDRLQGGRFEFTLRHELSSLLFLPLFERDNWGTLTEMVVAHHKSVENDAGLKGLLDLESETTDNFEIHLGDWWSWHKSGLEILNAFGLKTKIISEREAREAYDWVISYCDDLLSKDGYNEWRGLLVGADHFASALLDETVPLLPKMFQKPDLKAFERRSERFPLSLKGADDNRPHSLVIASTGAGKTDYLFRRCRGRVFYMLPFQASINAMYYRLKDFLTTDNPDFELRLKHGASKLHTGEKDDRSKKADESIQNLFGASVKVLTPFQVAAITLANKGYEAVILDLRNCDVILDEVHTFDGAAQGLVLKIIEVLTDIGCRIHVGTATMPTALFDGILHKLGVDNTLVTRLASSELDIYDRHAVIKSPRSCIDEGGNFTADAFLDQEELQKAIDHDQKVLLICNRVNHAQELFKAISERYPNTPKLLLHSRFKRGDRAKLESQLLGIDRDGNNTGTFNNSDSACIVVSTQVVEVSIDISFDLMITECAPLDALIQRFGRVNRKRLYARRPVIILAPPTDEKKALPYLLPVLQRTYETLADGNLKERDVQSLLDEVYPEVILHNINEVAAFKDGCWRTPQLTNQNEPLVQLLEIDSSTCIVETDREAYKNARGADRMPFEFSLRYWNVSECEQLEYGSNPFVIAEAAYDEQLGVDTKLINEFKTFL